MMMRAMCPRAEGRSQSLEVDRARPAGNLTADVTVIAGPAKASGLRDPRSMLVGEPLGTRQTLAAATRPGSGRATLGPWSGWPDRRCRERVPDNLDPNVVTD